jgi:hypothetical protein
MGLIALVPLLWQRAAFAELFWFGDEWDLLSQIDRMGFWNWTWHVFAENFVPVFKLLWGGGVYLFSGSYLAMLVLMWLTHAINTIQLGRVLRAAGFSWFAVLLTQAVFGLTAVNIETLGWTVQWSAVLATTFMLFALEWHVRRPAHTGPLSWRRHGVLLLLSAGSALSFSRGVLTGAVLALGSFLPSADAGPSRLGRRALGAAVFLLPAMVVALIIVVFASGNHQKLSGHLADAALYGLWYFCLNPLHRLVAIDSWGPVTTTLAGVIKVALMAWVLVRSKGSPRRLLVLLLAFDLGNSALLGIGRYHTGLETSISSRYQYGALVGVLPFAGLWLDLLWQRVPPLFHRWQLVPAAVVIAAALLAARPWARDAAEFARGRGTVTRELLQQPAPPAMGAVPGIPFLSTERAKELAARYHLH